MTQRILIVDDEEDIINLLRLILEDAGYEVHACTDGMDALTRLKHDTFDLVLLDIMMPVLTGWEVLVELRNHSLTKNMPVALLTARASPRDDDREYPMDFCEYITKPFEAEDLLTRIKQILSA